MIIIETISKTEQQLFLEMEALRTRLDGAEMGLQEANEILHAQIATPFFNPANLFRVDMPNTLFGASADAKTRWLFNPRSLKGKLHLSRLQRKPASK